jgi:hypothetical protein
MKIWQGNSRYTGHEIALYLSRKSRNAKTGDMIQSWILPVNVDPHTATRTGQDVMVCGTCPFRPTAAGGCYVATHRAPLSIHRAHAHKPVAGAGVVRAFIGSTPVRLGSYGDPAALPTDVVRYLARLANHRITGYSHGWRDRPDLAPYVMASVHSEEEHAAARALGFRTFRVRSPEAPNLTSEITCPSDRVSCADCLLCRGNVTGARSITIPVHGFAHRKALTVVQ